MWHVEKKALDYLHKGDVFWYKKKACVYACIVVEKADYGYYLIGLSDALQSVPVDVETVLKASLYTVAWFDECSVIKPKYRHLLGTINITADYSERCGLHIGNDGSIIVSNVGQSKTWTHDFRALKLPYKNMDVLLSPTLLPKTH